MVYAIRPDGTEIGHFSGGGMDSPWDTAIDGEDNVWVANFGPSKADAPFHRQADEALGSQCASGSQCGRSNITADRLHGAVSR